MVVTPGLSPPVAWVSLTPLLYPADIDRAAEIVLIFWFFEPAFLTRCLARLAALWFGTKLLTVGITRVRDEQHPTMLTFTLALCSYHWPEPPRAKVITL